MYKRQDIDAWKQEYLASVKPAPAQAQTGAPVQDGVQDLDSNLAPGSSELASNTETEKQLKNPKDIGAWENFVNNVKNVKTRILGFDDRLTLATVDTFEQLLGKEAAEKLNKALPTYDQDTGEWLDSSDEIRAAAYRELAETEAQQKQTIGLLDAWEEGSPTKILSAAAGAGLNMVSTLVTSVLTGGAGLYTDMVGDAIAESNQEKAKRLYGDDNPEAMKKLYDAGQSEFMTPALVGIAGGMLERLGAKGVGNYIKGAAGKVAGEAGKKAASLINNMGQEGMTEWLQTGLESYNRAHGQGKEDAAGLAIYGNDGLFSRQGLEAALQGAVGAGVGGGAGRGAKYYGEKVAKKVGLLPKGATPTADLAEAADDQDNLFDAKESEKNYKSQVEEVAKAKALLEQEYAEDDQAPGEGQTTLEQREGARETIQEAEAAKRAERTKKRQERQVVQDLNSEYETTTDTPTEEGRIAYVTRKLQENEGVQTFDEALARAKSKNRDARKIVTKAFIAARTQSEKELVDNVNQNLQGAKTALETAPEGPARDALQDLVNGYTEDLQNIYATANRKVLYSEPQAVHDAIEAYDKIESLGTQEAACLLYTSPSPRD